MNMEYILKQIGPDWGSHMTPSGLRADSDCGLEEMGTKLTMEGAFVPWGSPVLAEASACLVFCSLPSAFSRTVSTLLG